MIRRLYAVEKEAADRDGPSRLLLRQSRSTPILEQIRCSSSSNHALPRSRIAQAIGYTLNQWAALIVYTTDARLSPDNNAGERALRRVAVGRRNWTFCGHDESAQGHAILWSLIASAQRHQIDVQLYLRSVLAHLPALPPDELQNYLPDGWKRDLMAEQRAKLSAHHAALDRAVIR